MLNTSLLCFYLCVCVCLTMCVSTSILHLPNPTVVVVVSGAVSEPQSETDRSVCTQLQRNSLEMSQYTQEIGSFQSQLAATIVILLMTKTNFVQIDSWFANHGYKKFNKQQTNSPCITPTIGHANSIEFV